MFEKLKLYRWVFLAIVWIAALVIVFLRVIGSYSVSSLYNPSFGAILADPFNLLLVSLLAGAVFSSAIWLLLSKATVGRLILLGLSGLGFIGCSWSLNQLQLNLFQASFAVFLLMQPLGFIISAEIKGYDRTVDDALETLGKGYPIYVGLVLITIFLAAISLAGLISSMFGYSIIRFGLPAELLGWVVLGVAIREGRRTWHTEPRSHRSRHALRNTFLSILATSVLVIVAINLAYIVMPS